MNPLKVCTMKLRTLAFACVATSALLTACGGGGGSDPAPAPVLATVSSATAGAANLGANVLITVQGANLDKGLTLTSSGCTGLALSTAAPNVSSATTAYYVCKASTGGTQTVSIARTSDGAALTSATYTVTAATATSVSVGNPTVGQTALITVAGANLDLGVSVTSAGCAATPVISATAPNVSGPTAAYFNCTIGSAGAQTVNVTRTADGATLTSAAYTAVAAPPLVASVSNASASSTSLGQPVLITVQGANLTAGLTVTSSGCSNVALSTTAPNVSSATTAYYTCTASASGAQTVSIARISDGAVLATANFTVAAAGVTGASVSSALYSQTALFTVTGTNLDLGLSAVSAGCKSAPVLSTAAPNVSTATTAYFSCTIGKVGAQTLSLTRTADGVTLNSTAYTVEVPQVTLTTSNGAGVNGSIVITLEPVKAPITTDNFLAYIQSGFYVNTAYHRVLSGFVAQGGGYAAPITAAATPALKTTSAPITLEDGAGLSNLKYTVAMARTGVPDSATSQFFINLVNNTFLDKAGTARGYAVFGTVTSGTAVVDAMGAAPCTAATYSECVPIPNITITAATQTR
jgi:peptidyl-prolyl cis-trans isomerase A (cyclophilin A)